MPARLNVDITFLIDVCSLIIISCPIAYTFQYRTDIFSYVFLTHLFSSNLSDIYYAFKGMMVMHVSEII